jgi:cytochrome c oxidase accessory protein FixG
MAVSALMFLDFAWFREQTCMVACPYGRLQSVLLDRQSMIIGYDAARGEPRGKPRRAAGLQVLDEGAAHTGDCIDCGACVVTCPTNIDIRAGLQMECIGCAQCVDACDKVMDGLGKPRGLVRYASQDELAGQPRRLLRPRVVVYPALLVLAVGLLAWQAGARPAADVWVLRTEGAPFVVLGDGRVSTNFRVRIENRAEQARAYTVELVGADDAELAAPRAPQRLEPGATAAVAVVVLSSPAGFTGGERPVKVRIRDDAGFERLLDYTLLGPAGAAP